ncbi:MAG: hypothetical protein ACK4NO_00860 [Glycocaulis sp.]
MIEFNPTPLLIGGSILAAALVILLVATEIGFRQMRRDEKDN